MAFHVYVDGPIERTAEGMQRLAQAMCQRYGLRASDVVSRLSRGRFRVKANLDRPSADAYAHDLEKIGARVVVEEARDSQPIAAQRGDAVSLPPATTARSAAAEPPRTAGESSAPPSRPTPPASRVIVAKPSGRPYAFSTPPSGTPVTADPATATPGGRRAMPAAGSRTAPSPSSTTPSSGHPAQAARPATPSSRPVQGTYGPIAGERTPTPQRPSGRSTTPPRGRSPAQRTTTPPTGSPAHGDRSSVQRTTTPPSGSPAHMLSLAAVDGLETGAPLSVATFEPPPSTPAGRPTPPPADKDQKERPKDIPLDLFAPPEIGEQELQVELATDELEHQARKRASAPVPVIPPTQTPTPEPERPSSPVLPRKSQPSIAQPTAPTSSRSALPAPRWRLAAGVAVAIVLGFVPAHVVAASRESSAFRDIDAQVEQAQAAATTPEAYTKLDGFRADQLDRKRSSQRSIALTSMLIWAVLAGGLGYVWFRRIPWDRLARG